MSNFNLSDLEDLEAIGVSDEVVSMFGSEQELKKPHYRCLFRGISYLQDGATTRHEAYEVVALFESLENLLGNFRDYWCPQYLAEETCQPFTNAMPYEYHLISVEPVSGADPNIPLKFMNRKQLGRVVKVKQLRDIQPDAYRDVVDYRQGVQMALDGDPFLKTFQSRLVERTGKALAIDSLQTARRRKKKAEPEVKSTEVEELSKTDVPAKKGGRPTKADMKLKEELLEAQAKAEEKAQAEAEKE